MRPALHRDRPARAERVPGDVAPEWQPWTTWTIVIRTVGETAAAAPVGTPIAAAASTSPSRSFFTPPVCLRGHGARTGGATDPACGLVSAACPSAGPEPSSAFACRSCSAGSPSSPSASPPRSGCRGCSRTRSPCREPTPTAPASSSRATSASGPTACSPSSSPSRTRPTGRCARGSGASCARRRASSPPARAGQLQSGGGILFGNIDTTLDLQHAKKFTTTAATVPRGRAARLRDRPAGDPARPRAGALVRPAPRRGDRAADRAAHPRRGARALGDGADPVRLRRVHDHADADRPLRDRAPLLHGQLRDEPRRADRARARRRLLAADRVALPRGARPGGHDGRGDRARRWRRPDAPSSSRG